MPRLTNRKIFNCKSCNTLIWENTYKYGTGHCNSCANSGKNNPNYIDGRTKNKKYYCKKCKASISISSAKYGSGCCQICSEKGKVITNSKRYIYKGYSMRSTWEVKYAKYLDKNNIKWYYEIRKFHLGNTSYTPDFYLEESGFFIEIKGYFTKEAKKKVSKFKRMYPKIKFKILREMELKKLGVL